MDAWEVRLKHESDVLRCHQFAGNKLTEDGGLIVFHGPVFWTAMKAVKHTSSHYEDCLCRKKEQFHG